MKVGVQRIGSSSRWVFRNVEPTLVFYVNDMTSGPDVVISEILHLGILVGMLEKIWRPIGAIIGSCNRSFFFLSAK